MRGIYLITLIVMSCIALASPFSYNGKQYYTVTSTDPNMDTGTEVCTAAGLSCVGYTEASSAVCKLAHPGAAESSGVSGDLSGTYCNGLPQTGVCGALSDTCLTCPSCTNTVSCNTPIGGLYREMYVECAGACKIKIYANDIADLINQIPSINAQLQGCPQKIPSAANSIVKDGNTVVDVTRNSGSTESFTIQIQNKQITGVSTGAASTCAQRISVSEADLDTALKSQNIGTAASYLLGQKKIKVTGCTFISKVKFFFVNPFARMAARKAAPTAPPARPAPNCGQVGEQCNNRACFSGMCGAPKENINGQWRYVNYRCIDQADYNANCLGQGNTPPAWSCIINACR